MLDISANLQSKLNDGVTTLCQCWRVQRRDGAILGFTDHDTDIFFNSVRFLAGAGLAASQVESALGLAAASGEIIGAFSHENILEVDLRNGLYDGASVEVWLVDWLAVEDRVLLDISVVGEVRHTESSFNAELRSQACLFDQQRGAAYQKVCAADLGDRRCGVDLSSSSYRRSGTIESTAGGVLKVVLTESVPDGFFTGGAFLFADGANHGAQFTIKSHLHFGDHAHISLWTRPAGVVASGASVTLVAGCDKRASTCNEKFRNIANFRGFPLMPGNDRLLAYPGSREHAMDGGSFFK